jgi:hypothetical protein
MNIIINLAVCVIEACFMLLVWCGASGKTLYWVLLLAYVGPRARHFTGYCCWLMWGLGQHTLLDIVVGLCASGNTLLGIAVGLCGPRATHFTGCCCWLCCASGNTLLAIVVGLRGASDNTLYWVMFVGYARFSELWEHFQLFRNFCTGCRTLCSIKGGATYWH